jgi:hypothetical protein
VPDPADVDRVGQEMVNGSPAERHAATGPAVGKGPGASRPGRACRSASAFTLRRH